MSLQGTLKTLGITEVLEFLAARNATGQLDVTTEMGTAAYYFLDGLVTNSEYSFIRESGSDSAEATYYVVSELDGTFFFDEETVPSENEGAEEVSSILGRTAGIAEQWHEVEEAIPTPNHLLVRNNELDSSVTIEPEWWRVLEIIGSGQTSLQIAESLELGVLDASLTALAMSNAGLLLVEEIDPLSIDVAEIEPTAESDSDTPEVMEHQPEASEDALVESVEHEPVLAEHAPVETLDHEPIAMDEMPLETLSPVEAPTPEAVADSHPESAIAEAPPVAQPEPIMHETAPQPAPVMHEVAPQPAPVMHEVAPQPAPVMHDEIAAEQTQPAALEALEAHDDDDGWLSDHSPAYEAPAAAEPPSPVEQPVAEAPQPIAGYAEPAGDVAMPPPTMPSMPQMPAQEIQPVMASEVFGTAAPAADAMPAPADIIESEYGANETNTALAGEVLNDLASLTEQLENPAAADASWQLDGTFVAEQEVPAPSVDADPFGDLGELLDDAEGDEDRGSVLKFLRRD